MLNPSALQPTWNVRQKTTQGWMLRFTASFWLATSAAEGKPVSLNAFLADELMNKKLGAYGPCAILFKSLDRLLPTGRRPR